MPYFFQLRPTIGGWLTKTELEKKKTSKKNEIYKKNRPMGLRVFFLSYTISD